MYGQLRAKGLFYFLFLTFYVVKHLVEKRSVCITVSDRITEMLTCVLQLYNSDFSK